MRLIFNSQASRQAIEQLREMVVLTERESIAFKQNSSEPCFQPLMKTSQTATMKTGNSFSAT